MTTEKKIVSVIVPVYNRANYLEECVASVLNQTYQDFEILLIDDGSTDNSLALCHELHRQDNRVRVLESAHLGVSGARNLGLDAAQGEYVFFLDSDDIIHPSLLKELVTGLEAHGVPLGGTGCRYCRADMWEKNKPRFLQDDSAVECAGYNHEETLNAVFSGKSPLGLLGGVIMRRDLIGDTRFRTDFFIGEDFYFIYENLVKGAGAAFLKPRWYLARNHSANTSKNYGFDGFWSRFHRRELVWKSELAFGRTKYANREKLDAVGSFFTCLAKNKLYGEESRKMRKTIKTYRAELWPAMGWKLKIVFLLRLYCPFGAWVLLDRCKKRAVVQQQTRPALAFKQTEEIEEHKTLLLEFLQTPLNDGEQILQRFATLPGAVVGQGDKPLQRYVFVPGSREDGVALVAHVDTVWDKVYQPDACVDQTITYENGVFSGTNPAVGIGADDRAGCAMLWALRNCGHSLLVVDGEEHGKRGARYLRTCNKSLFHRLNRHSYMIELDWAGTRSCLFNQVDNTKRFKSDMQSALNLADGGPKGGTDLEFLCRHVCGINIGVGYHGWHKGGERLVLAEWENTLAELSAFLAKPQRRYRTKFWPHYIRKAKMLAGRPFRVIKRLLGRKAKG